MKKANWSPITYPSKKRLQSLCDSLSYYVLQLDQLTPYGSLLSPEFRLNLSGYPFCLPLYIIGCGVLLRHIDAYICVYV